MNYFALAGAVIAGLVGINTVFRFVRVAFGKARWVSAYGPAANLIWATLCITLSMWLFSVAHG